ncbi:hypothetical protein A9B99_21925 [Mangrovibacter phragmitis]|uniref:Uncharacterized protein n=1 Tax=Mangrovibacter phragmitis TaxID=1691903 RepID=A0A1B7L4Y4_9ENTR|nr:hypothetical protein A9B99_21925 [Mangrovibacter phragmitis]
MVISDAPLILLGVYPFSNSSRFTWQHKQQAQFLNKPLFLKPFSSKRATTDSHQPYTLPRISLCLRFGVAAGATTAI